MAHRILTRIKDADGKLATHTLNILDGSTDADVAAFAVDWAAALRPLLDGQIDAVQVVHDIDISSVTNIAPLSTADIEERARFVFETAEGFSLSFTLPTFKEAKLLPVPADEVDTSDADVAALVTLLTDGKDMTSGFVYPGDRHGERLTALRSAREYFTG